MMGEARKQWGEALRGGLVMAAVLTVVLVLSGVRGPLFLAGWAILTAVVFTPLFHHLEATRGGPSPVLALAIGVAGLALNGFVLIAHPPSGWDWAPWFVVVGIFVWLALHGIVELRGRAGDAHDPL